MFLKVDNSWFCHKHMVKFTKMFVKICHILQAETKVGTQYSLKCHHWEKDHIGLACFPIPLLQIINKVYCNKCYN